jgi:hypothetical protein
VLDRDTASDEYSDNAMTAEHRAMSVSLHVLTRGFAFIINNERFKADFDLIKAMQQHYFCSW